MAGAVAGMIVVARRCASIASEKEVSMNRMATAVVALPSTVGVLIDPKTAWLPVPPKAEPISAPLPAWSKHESDDEKADQDMKNHDGRMNIPRLLLQSAAFGGALLRDGDEARGLQAGAADEDAVDVRLLGEGPRHCPA